MIKFTKKDLIFSLITGFYTGVIVWQILNFLGVSMINFWDLSNCTNDCTPDGICTMAYCIPDYAISFSSKWFVLIIPILWVFGVNLGYFLGKWISFFNQFGKFAAIGFTNTAVDFAILNFLIALTGIASGWGYTAFKAVSFFVSAVHSYGWNRIWVFESSVQDKRSEFIKFFTVAVFAILVNVGVASFIVNFIDPIWGLEESAWANIGAAAGSASALFFGFVGLRFIVFKKKEDVIS